MSALAVARLNPATDGSAQQAAQAALRPAILVDGFMLPPLDGHLIHRQ
jgi:hypothetical protein